MSRAPTQEKQGVAFIADSCVLAVQEGVMDSTSALSVAVQAMRESDYHKRVRLGRKGKPLVSIVPPVTDDEFKTCENPECGEMFYRDKSKGNSEAWAKRKYCDRDCFAEAQRESRLAAALS